MPTIPLRAICHLMFAAAFAFCNSVCQFSLKKTLPCDALFRKRAKFHIGCIKKMKTEIQKTKNRKPKARKKWSIRKAITHYLCGSGGTLSTSALAWLSKSLYQLNIKSNDLTFTPASSCLKSFVFVQAHTHNRSGSNWKWNFFVGNFVGCLYDFGNCWKRKALTIASHRW